MEKQEYQIIAGTGIHGPSATLLFQTAYAYTSAIHLEYQRKPVNLKSIMSVMSLGVGQGSNITITVEGPDEQEAMKGIEETLKKERIID